MSLSHSHVSLRKSWAFYLMFDQQVGFVLEARRSRDASVGVALATKAPAKTRHQWPNPFLSEPTNMVHVHDLSLLQMSTIRWLSFFMHAKI